jgi:hypothetical protein
VKINFGKVVSMDGLVMGNEVVSNSPVVRKAQFTCAVSEGAHVKIEDLKHKLSLKGSVGVVDYLLEVYFDTYPDKKG